MARADWLRTFLAIYRSGSVTAGAHHRGLTQPAASQHLAALEGSLGGPLFVRSTGGMEPTQQGRELYARVAEPLDGLEAVLRDLEAGALRLPEAPVRLGSSPEFFSAVVLGRLVGVDVAVTATFGRDVELFSQLERGDLDIVVTSSTPPRRSIAATPLGHTSFVLVVAPGAAPSSMLSSLGQVAAWLRDRSWVSYSLELPRTLSVLAVGTRAPVLGSTAPRRPRPARRAQGGGARTRRQPAARVRLCGIPGTGTRGGAVPRLPPDLGRAVVRLHPVG